MSKEYKTRQIRNVAILGHGSTGKSTLLDAVLFAGGQIERMGSPKDGSLASDFDEEEKSRGMSIRSAMGFIEFDDVKINVLDTPGMADFVGEARAALQAADTAILIVDSVDGVQIETEKAWRYLSERNIPRIIFVNKMDKERANFNGALENIEKLLNIEPVPLSIPIGEGNGFSGVINIMEMKAVTPKGSGKDVQSSEVPSEMKDNALLIKEKIIELAAEGDDALIEKFLEGGELTDDEIETGLKKMVGQAKMYPVLCGSSLNANGVHTLIKVIKEYAPAPDFKGEYAGHDQIDRSKEIKVQVASDKPFSAVVWKTYIDQYAGRFNYLKVISGQLVPDSEVLNSTKNSKERVSKLFSLIGNKQVEIPCLNAGDIGVVVKLEKTTTKDTLCDNKKVVVLPIINLPEPVFSFAVESTKKGDEDKIGQVMNRITDENPTITYMFNPETKQTVLSGMGEMQLDIILKSIKEKNKIELSTKEPRIAYKETITKKAEAQYKHKKQSGGHGQYGEVYLRVAPLERGVGFEFKDSIVGGVIPKGYIPGVEKGVREGLEEGPLARFPVVDVWVELYFGSYHDVDSSEMSFKIAGRNAVKKAVEASGPQILEPVMEVEIYADKDFMGDILNDITSKRGRVLGMGARDESDSGGSVIKASVPLAEMLRYSIDLRAMTSGKATFEMKFSHYNPISGKIAEKVIEERMKQLEEEANK